MYKVWIIYPDGQRKQKGSFKLAETAFAYEEHLQGFFGKGGFTKAPDGKQFETADLLVVIEQE